jgi:hypothetical protein
MEHNSIFIKTDDNKLINTTYIKWVKKMDDCMSVCMKANGCTGILDTHTICKSKNFWSYTKLNEYFE